MTDKTKRGKRDTNLNIVQGGFANSARRPDPPSEMTDTQKTIWRDFVKTESPDFFSSQAQQDMLKYLVGHADAIKVLTAKIDEFQKKPAWLNKDAGIARYDRLLRLRAAETRNFAQLATRMRMTNQSRYTPNHAYATGKNTAKSRPWEEDD